MRHSKSNKTDRSILTEAEAKEAMQAGAIFKEDAGRGWRKVVPSPKPIDIHEAETINTLIKMI